MRLIDADALCEKIRKIYDGYMLDEGGSTPTDFENMVNDMPTAFDTEKVINQLEEVGMNYYVAIANTRSEKLDIVYGYASDPINKAIDIVKKGGVK